MDAVFKALADPTRRQDKLIDAFASGWPLILSSLKSLLETGKALPGTDRLPDE